MADIKRDALLPVLSAKNIPFIANNIYEINFTGEEIDLINIFSDNFDGNFIIINNIKGRNLKLNEYNVFKEEHGLLAKLLRVEKNGDTIQTVIEVSDRVGITGYEKIKTIPYDKIATYVFLRKSSKSNKIITEARQMMYSALFGSSAILDIFTEEDANSFFTLGNEVFIDKVAMAVLEKNDDLLIYSEIQTIVDRYLFVAKCISNKVNRNDNDLASEQVMKEVRQKVGEKISKQQREYYLREQIKTAQAELDDLNGETTEIETLRKRVNENPYPEHIKDKALKEISRLDQTPSQAQEANITRSYIEWLLDLPYWQEDKEIIDITNAKKALDKDHFGLDKPKSKIIEFLAVKQQNPDAKGSILALVGPPGTGKTTMAKSIANALGRKLIKISLGGVKDESEIRGHRRTYIASQPGKIIQGMKKAGVTNPIILLDEIDKMSADFKGDPTSAMLEVLDYEQNVMFQDHYLEEEYDLSKVTFIATANYYANIPEVLIDRLDIIEVSSYTELEKIEILKKHLIPRIIEETKIPKGLYKWSEAGIKEIIRHYTIEAGVRMLHREANTLARKILVDKFNGEVKSSLTITPEVIKHYLGPQKFDYTRIDKKPQVGTVTGLAWTSYGGDILPIEISLYKGKGDLILTGQLAEVMRESASIALSHVKANREKYNLSEDINFDELNIHVHSPDGATPKDGPSAGVTFTTALISALTGKPVSQYIGMTGEMSLRGHVLPIGGLKEKSISAHRSGIKEIFVPKKNVKDLINIPEEVKDNLIITPVETYKEIFDKAFK